MAIKAYFVLKPRRIPFQGMKKELDSLLQTAEKAFAVELLTMLAAIRKRKDFLDLQAGKEAALAVAVISKTKSLVSLVSGLNGELNPLSSATNLRATAKVPNSWC
ncbi:borealin-2-like isoform X2 [Myiozetetes cayanensis]|uniref:borealin-2-like isoform X2 n=1 Tax=Myiozetetes cayanensis TaxID=478635 RepID=UPI00215ED1E2|nr:borealin-2-like isoform X2 [Myiozetetes cayanensis]